MNTTQSILIVSTVFLSFEAVLGHLVKQKEENVVVKQPVIEEPGTKPGPEKPEATTAVRYCQPQTPCAWQFYNLNIRVDDSEYLSIVNKYCICQPHQRCKKIHENEFEKYSVVFCRERQHSDDSSAFRRRAQWKAKIARQKV